MTNGRCVMKTLFPQEWLRRKIGSDPDVDVEAGPTLDDWAFLAFSGEESMENTNLATIRERHVVPLRM